MATCFPFLIAAIAMAALGWLGLIASARAVSHEPSPAPRARAPVFHRNSRRFIGRTPWLFWFGLVIVFCAGFVVTGSLHVFGVRHLESGTIGVLQQFVGLSGKLPRMPFGLRIEG